MSDGPDKGASRAVLATLRRLMAGERMTVRSLAVGGTFSADAARRYLTLLEEEVPGVVGDGHWRREWRYQAPPAVPADGDVGTALAIAAGILQSLKGSRIELSLRQLAIRVLVTTGGGPDEMQLRRMFYTKSKVLDPVGAAPDSVDKVVRAILDTRRLRVIYDTFDGELIDCVLEPYSLLFADEGVYLYGRRLDADGRVFDGHLQCNLERLRGVEMLGERFDYPPEAQYDPHRDFRYCFGTFLPRDRNEQPARVVLRFSDRWKHYLRRHRWHVTQSAPMRVPSNEGDLWEIELKVYLTQDLSRWVRSFGPEVSVVDPPELAALVGG